MGVAERRRAGPRDRSGYGRADVSERWAAARKAYLRGLVYDLEQPWRDVKDALNAAQKYVVSQTLTDPLPWPNSTLVSGNVVEAVAKLRSRPGRELHIMGSGQLIETLVAHQLVDEFLLMIFPVVLGCGRHLFSGDTYMKLDLVDAKATGSGVVIATFRRSSPIIVS